MSRKPLSVWEQENKKQFDKMLKEYSTECLEQIHSIATKSLDQRTRLLANEYIIDKCFGKDHKAYLETFENETNEVNINLIVQKSSIPSVTDIEKKISDLEQQEYNTTNDGEKWELNDSWGDDVYIPDNN